jgi:hypothetical protein
LHILIRSQLHSLLIISSDDLVVKFFNGLVGIGEAILEFHAVFVQVVYDCLLLQVFFLVILVIFGLKLKGCLDLNVALSIPCCFLIAFTMLDDQFFMGLLRLSQLQFQLIDLLWIVVFIDMVYLKPQLAKGLLSVLQLLVFLFAQFLQDLVLILEP